MSNKSQASILPQISKQQASVAQPSILISPSFQHKENHLSSTYESLLRHEQQNFQIQNLTKNVKVPKIAVQAEMKEPLVASTLKGEQIFQKYGSLIQNQPIFLRQLIFHNYLSYLPSKFQDQFSQIMLVGSGFQFAWWGSLALVLFRAYRNRNVEASGRQKAAKALGLGFLFLASSLGFHQEYYIPKLRKCYYMNIKSIDSLMDRHIKILRSCGANFEVTNEQIKNINNQIKDKQNDIQKVKIVPQIKSTQKQIKK